MSEACELVHLRNINPSEASCDEHDYVVTAFDRSNPTDSLLEHATQDAACRVVTRVMDMQGVISQNTQVAKTQDVICTDLDKGRIEIERAAQDAAQDAQGVMAQYLIKRSMKVHDINASNANTRNVITQNVKVKTHSVIHVDLHKDVNTHNVKTANAICVNLNTDRCDKTRQVNTCDETSEQVISIDEETAQVIAVDENVATATGSSVTEPDATQETLVDISEDVATSSGCVRRRGNEVRLTEVTLRDISEQSGALENVSFSQVCDDVDGFEDDIVEDTENR